MSPADSVPARALLDAQGKILERMAGGATLRETLNRIALLMERLAPPALCSVVLVQPDGKHLKPIAAPSLPPAYCAAIDEVEIGPNCGSCGTAAWRKEPVVVTDIATDPLWEGPRAFTLSFGLRACWSLPILHDDGSVLGTIALYYREPRGPTDVEWDLLTPCAKLIRLALAINRKEHDLRASETRWQLAAEASGLGTYDLDYTTGLHRWSAPLRQILGLDEGVQASIETFAGLLHSDDRELFLAKLPDDPDPSLNTPWRLELRIHRANDGEERAVVLKGRVLFSRDGSPLHAVGTLVDVTERHRREDDLRRAKTEAEAASRAKSKFLASMSHELRTPLNAIIGFSDMIRSQVFGPISPEGYGSYIEDIHKGGTHLLNLINDVLDMAKIEAQRFELHRTTVGLSTLADSAVLLVRPQAQSKGVELLIDLPAGVSVSADERALRQVLVNLLANSVKFTNDGGTVRLFGDRLPSGGLALGVDDNGAGMTEEGIATALEPFGQVQMDVTAERAGTGLGLPLAKALFEAHGAVFRITSELGVGTRVWGEFPARDVTGAEPKTTARR